VRLLSVGWAAPLPIRSGLGFLVLGCLYTYVFLDYGFDQNYMCVFAKVQNTNLQEDRAASGTGRTSERPYFLVFGESELGPDTSPTYL
jgi:hypothetical protein